MLVIRSILFNVCFYTFSIFMMIVCMPHVFLLSRKRGKSTVDFWCHGNMWLAKVICGIRVEYRGTENIPEGGCLVASKHQSTWDTFGLIPLFSDPAYILKQELMWLPLFGWYVAKWNMIPINRREGKKAIPKMIRRANDAIENGRNIILFPEGTRRPVGAEPAYRQGIVKLYSQLKTKVIPIALNSGQFWPRRSFKLYPGTLIVEILPAIEPGMEQQEFFEHLQEVIESTTARLQKESTVGVKSG